MSDSGNKKTIWPNWKMGPTNEAQGGGSQPLCAHKITKFVGYCRLRPNHQGEHSSQIGHPPNIVDIIDQYVQRDERISTADYELRQFILGANLTPGQRKRLEEIRQRMSKPAAASPETACVLCDADQPLDQSGNYHDMGGNVKQKCTRKPETAAQSPTTPEEWKAITDTIVEKVQAVTDAFAPDPRDPNLSAEAAQPMSERGKFETWHEKAFGNRPEWLPWFDRYPTREHYRYQGWQAARAGMGEQLQEILYSINDYDKGTRDQIRPLVDKLRALIKSEATSLRPETPCEQCEKLKAILEEKFREDQRWLKQAFGPEMLASLRPETGVNSYAISNDLNEVAQSHDFSELDRICRRCSMSDTYTQAFRIMCPKREALTGAGEKKS